MASVRIFAGGRHLYYWVVGRDDVFLGTENISAKQLTSELGCRLEIEYHGEERGDDDERAYENGELVAKWAFFKIDTMNSEVEELNRIIDGIKKKGLTREAEELRCIVTRMAARYLFHGR